MAGNTTYTIQGDWDKEFKRFIGRLGGLSTSWRRMPPHVQNEAAHIMADIYRMRIRQGIDPENSMLTQIVYGIHPPLSGLADYIMVVEAGTQTRGKSTYPGRTKPALVTWHPDWAEIAFMHDRGYAFVPTPQQKAFLFARALDVVGSKDNFLEEGNNNNGVWLIPARPHAHFLNDDVMDRMLMNVAKAKVAGLMINLKSERPKSEPYRSFDRGGNMRDNIDDMHNLSSDSVKDL